MTTQSQRRADQPCVLVVDDYADARFIVREILCYSGFDVLEAANGPDALRTALEDAPDIILMDLSLPGLDGSEVTKRLRLDDRTRTTPVIAFTAHALDADKQRAMDAGCDRVLVKPCQPNDIVDAVREVLAKARAAEAPARASAARESAREGQES